MRPGPNTWLLLLGALLAVQVVRGAPDPGRNGCGR